MNQFPDHICQKYIYECNFKNSDNQLLMRIRKSFTEQIEKTLYDKQYCMAVRLYFDSHLFGPLNLKNILTISKELNNRYDNVYFPIKSIRHKIIEMKINEFDPLLHEKPNSILIKF
jgi:hypothetical protein